MPANQCHPCWQWVREGSQNPRSRWIWVQQAFPVQPWRRWITTKMQYLRAAKRVTACCKNWKQNDRGSTKPESPDFSDACEIPSDWTRGFHGAALLARPGIGCFTHERKNRLPLWGGNIQKHSGNQSQPLCRARLSRQYNNPFKSETFDTIRYSRKLITMYLHAPSSWALH